MSRCQAFPPLGFVWNGVSGNDLIQLLKVRKEKAEFEKEERRKAKRLLKEERRKAKRLLKKSRKHDQIEEKNVHKEDHCNKKQKVRKEKAESEKEERRKAKKMLKKSRKHDQIEDKNMHKEDHRNKKQKTEDNIGHELQHTRKGNEVRTPKNNSSSKPLEAVQIELLQLRELFENIGLHEAKQTRELQLKEFFDNWAPPPINRYLETEDEDLDWLLGARRDSTRRTAETSTTTLSYPSSRMADVVYAMPYTMIV